MRIFSIRQIVSVSEGKLCIKGLNHKNTFKLKADIHILKKLGFQTDESISRHHLF